MLMLTASCCNEAFKLATTAAPRLDNYMMVRYLYGCRLMSSLKYTGNDSIYTYTFEHEQRPECPVCGGESVSADVGRDWTLERLLEWLEARQDLYAYFSKGFLQR